MAEFETTFADLGLKAPILEALNDLGYEKPSPIQAQIGRASCRERV